MPFIVSIKDSDEQSTWSTRRLAAAEVSSIVKKRYKNDKSVKGSEVWFTESIHATDPASIDSESIIYGKDWGKQKAFIDAQKQLPPTPAELAKANGKKRGGWH